MKKHIYVLIAVVFLGTSGCFDEYDGTIDVSQPWIYFESSSIRFAEDGSGAVTTTLLLSAELQDSDVTIPFTLSSEDGLAEGTDYIISASSFTIPAGKSSAEVILLDGVVNNAEAVGDRSLVITLLGTEAFNAGFPGPAGNKSSITVTIAEDDFTIYGETSFEEVESPVDDVLYLRPGTVEMGNNAGDPPVDFVATGSELGFDTSYAVDDIEETSSSERVGVMNNTALAASGDAVFETTFQRGSQGFISSDMDGRIEILFDDISIPSTASTVVVELTFYVNNSNIETEDRLEVFFVTEDGKGDALLAFGGDDDTGSFEDSDGVNVQGAWTTRIVDLPVSQRKNGRLFVTMRNGADSEMYWIDYIAVKGIE